LAVAALLLLLLLLLLLDHRGRAAQLCSSGAALLRCSLLRPLLRHALDAHGSIVGGGLSCCVLLLAPADTSFPSNARSRPRDRVRQTL
jgi:hypothetical protein